jgi:hypothetical protein
MTRTIAATVVVALMTAQASAQQQKHQRLAMICFFKSEEQSGMTKICYYDCLGSRAAITVSSTTICPLSIER